MEPPDRLRAGRARALLFPREHTERAGGRVTQLVAMILSPRLFTRLASNPWESTGDGSWAHAALRAILSLVNGSRARGEQSKLASPSQTHRDETLCQPVVHRRLDTAATTDNVGEAPWEALTRGCFSFDRAQGRSNSHVQGPARHPVS